MKTRDMDAVLFSNGRNIHTTMKCIAAIYVIIFSTALLLVHTKSFIGLVFKDIIGKVS